MLSPWGHKESDTTEVTEHTRTNVYVLPTEELMLFNCGVGEDS